MYERNSHVCIKQAIINLIKELPEKHIVYQTISYGFTAKELIEQIQNDSDIGKQYISELLRISRDLIARQQGRGKLFV